MRDILRKAKPQRLDDLIALNALYRPGPLRSGMVDDFIARKHGKVKVTYEVKELEPILADTYGVIAYQEQVMRIASVLAGFTLGEADLLRKAMGKKKADVMQAQREEVRRRRNRKRGINEKKATKIFDLMEHFAGYGFNKSHSTAYALLAYQTAYLKANYPWHFAAALLTIEAQNTDKLSDVSGRSVATAAFPVLPPDINKSQLPFTVTPDGVRFGLTAVKNVGEGAIASILAARASLGTITSIHALCEALDLRLVNKRVLESLVKAGAFDSLGTGKETSLGELRARLMATIDSACEYGARRSATVQTGRRSCSPRRVDGEGRSRGHRRSRRRDALDRSAAARVRERSPRAVLQRPSDRSRRARTEGARREDHRGALPRSRERARGRRRRKCHPRRPRTATGASAASTSTVGGIIASVRQLKTRKGDRMAVITLEDPHGSIEVVIFPEAYAKSARMLEAGAMVVVKGKVELDEEIVRMTSSEVLSIEAMRAEDVARVVDQADVAAARPRRRSRRLPICFRGIAATAEWCSSSNFAISSRRSGCAQGSRRRCACARPSSSPPKWNGFAVPGRWSCDDTARARRKDAEDLVFRKEFSRLGPRETESCRRDTRLRRIAGADAEGSSTR